MQLEFISAKSTFAVDGGGGGGRRGSLKSKRKQTGGESGQGYLYVCSVKKIASLFKQKTEVLLFWAYPGII